MSFTLITYPTSDDYFAFLLRAVNSVGHQKALASADPYSLESGAV
jgi:hypothetical protein